LIIFGTIWTLSRLFNQPKMFRVVRELVRKSNLMVGIKSYLIGELFGLGVGLTSLGFGVYLFRPEFLFIFFWIAGILLILIFLWGSFELGSLPQALIIIIGVIGFIGWGLGGLIGGLILGWIVSLLIGLFTIPFTKIFKVGVIKREYRLAIAKDFFSQHKKDILFFKKFKSLNQGKIVGIFSNYINQIHNEASRLPNPKRLHKYDMDISGYRENFEKAGEIWISKFKEEDERELMRQYLNFCIDAIYTNRDRYIKNIINKK